MGVQDSLIHQIFWAAKALAWISIIYCSIRFKLIRKYPTIFLYVFTGIFLQVTMLFAAYRLGTHSLAYSYLYVARSFLTIALASFAVLSIYSVLTRFKFKTDWHLIGVPLALLLFGFLDSRGMGIYLRLLDLGYAILSYLGVVTVIRMRFSKSVLLGWNLKMTLLAMTMPPVFYSIVFMAYTMGLDFPRKEADLWTNGIGVASWVIIAVAMSDYSPPQIISEGKASGEDRAIDPGNNDGVITKRETECCTF